MVFMCQRWTNEAYAASQNYKIPGLLQRHLYKRGQEKGTTSGQPEHGQPSHRSESICSTNQECAMISVPKHGYKHVWSHSPDLHAVKATRKARTDMFKPRRDLSRLMQAPTAIQEVHKSKDELLDKKERVFGTRRGIFEHVLHGSYCPLGSSTSGRDLNAAVSSTYLFRRSGTDVEKEKAVYDKDFKVSYIPSETHIATNDLLKLPFRKTATLFKSQNMYSPSVVGGQETSEHLPPKYKYKPRKEASEYCQSNRAQQYIRRMANMRKNNQTKYAEYLKRGRNRMERIKKDPELLSRHQVSRRKHDEKVKELRRKVRMGTADDNEYQFVARLRQRDKDHKAKTAKSKQSNKRGDLHENGASLSNTEGFKTARPKLMLDLNTPPPFELSDDENSEKYPSGTPSSINQSCAKTRSPTISIKEQGKNELPAWRMRYNMKRRQKRAEQLRTNPKVKAKIGKEYERRKENMKIKQLIWEQNPALQNLRDNNFTPLRTQIRKYVREGKGTEEEKAYVKKLSISDLKYKKAKREAKKAKSILMLDVYSCSPVITALYKRGSPGRSTPPRQPVSDQQQPADSFSSFQHLLKMNPEDLQVSFENEDDSSATSHYFRNVPHSQIIKPKPSRPHKSIAVQTEHKTQSKPDTEVTAKRKPRKRAEDYNLKRRLKRAQLKMNAPDTYQKGLEDERARNVIRRKRRKELALSRSPSSESTAINRAAIRKRVREGKGTEEDKDYIEKLRIKNQMYRRRKSYENLLKLKGPDDQSPNSRGSH
ncbi:uncharacterized protein FA14DRAFT_181611 [Meira miltonrushii]|uniref:Uncharacterized protein n=1 Tax=Meira miltonrushii TaxID=1280837 RepID=A0A316V9U3_9BASI|nr:uncharacterized protein FA14DRAFT_181611 [Meira miltonrushii]PWN32943.1 hypothetical protein FA14DRAFT_181611 [Meira miltonrushii]